MPSVSSASRGESSVRSNHTRWSYPPDRLYGRSGAVGKTISTFAASRASRNTDPVARIQSRTPSPLSPLPCSMTTMARPFPRAFPSSASRCFTSPPPPPSPAARSARWRTTVSPTHFATAPFFSSAHR